MRIITWARFKGTYLLLKYKKRIANKRFYAGAVSRAKVLNNLQSLKQRAVLWLVNADPSHTQPVHSCSVVCGNSKAALLYVVLCSLYVTSLCTNIVVINNSVGNLPVVLARAKHEKVILINKMVPACSLI